MLENFRSQKIIWDRANKTIFEKIEANSGDSNGRKLVVQVINQGVTENLLGTTLSLGWKHRKGAKGLDAFSVVDDTKGVFEIYYTTEMLSNVGNIEASLILTDSTGRIESSTFTISVTPSTVDDESVESENSFTALTEALVKVSEWSGRIDDVEQDYANRAEALEETYAPRLTEVTAQLVQNVNKNPIYLTDYGVNPINTATKNTALIRQAILDAESENRPIILPWVPDGEFIDINDSLPISTGGIKVSGYGRQSKIRQKVFPKQIFHVTGNDVEIESFTPSGVDFNPTGMADSHVTYAGVYVEGHRVKVNNVFGDNLSTVVNVVGSVDDLLEDVSVTNIESTNRVVFNLLFSGTKNLFFDNIHGSYSFMGTATPPHLIYSSQAFGDNYDVTGGTANSVNGKGSYAFQFKGMRGGYVDTLKSKNSEGSLHVMESSSFKVGKVISVDDTWTGLQQASLELEGINDNIRIDSVDIQLKENGKPLRISSETSNSEIKEAKVAAKHTTPNLSNDAYDVDVRGTNNTVKNVESINKGSERWIASIGIWSGVNNVIDSPKTSGNTDGVIVRQSIIGSGSVIKNYNKDEIVNYTRRKLSIELPTKIIPVVSIVNKKSLAYDNVDGGTGSFGVINYTSSGHKWVNEFGDMRVNDVGRISNFGTSDTFSYIELGTSNIDFSADVTYYNRESLVVRAVNRRNAIGVRLDHILNKAYIFVTNDGNLSILGEVPYMAQIGRVYNMRAMIYKNVVDMYIDGQKILTTTLSEEVMTKHGNAKKHGIIVVSGNGGMFDNLEWNLIE